MIIIYGTPLKVLVFHLKAILFLLLKTINKKFIIYENQVN
jgi:hypothetical protein